MVSITKTLIQVLLIIVLSTSQPSQPKLIFIQQIFRHGARYPEHILNIGDEFVGKQQLMGELSDEGRSMHYLLGQKMYKTYWKKLFGGTKYQHTFNQSRFFVKSTNVNRTIESVQSQLYGILESLPPLVIQQNQAKFSSPPYPGVYTQAGFVFGQKGQKFHPLAVHVEKPNSNPTEVGDFLYAFDKKFCPNQAVWTSMNAESQKSKIIYSTPAIVDAMRQLSLSLGSDPNLVNSSNFYSYYDNLICLNYLGKPVPSILTTPSPTQRTLAYLYSINANIAFTLNETQVKTTSTPFFRESLENIYNTISDPGAPQWILYSAHDATLTVLLGGLGLWSAECIYKNFLKGISDPQDCITTFPIFATVMVFEVYKYETDNRQNKNIFYSKNQTGNQLYTLKINYNGQYKKMPFCGNLEECEIKAFEEWVNTWAIQDFMIACGVNKSKEYQETIKLVAIGTALSMILSTIWFFILASKIKKIIASKVRAVFQYIGVVDSQKKRR